MGLFSKLRAEFIDIVEWIDDSRHTLVWRFPRYHNQIKNGAQLIVRPGQRAIFVHQGTVADIFDPGQYTLETKNLPILSTLQGWKYGFDSPFKAEVYFVSTRVITDLKWGTPNPIMLRDADFGPIRLRAFGSYTLRAIDPKILLTELVGTDGMFETAELETLMRSIVAESFADMLAEQEIPALDLARSYSEMAEKLRVVVNERIDDEYGLEVPQVFLVNVSLPEEVEKALDTRTKMGVIGDMGRFQQYQMGQAMTDAANNPSGGGAADGMGLGMGFAMAQQMANNFGQQNAGGGAPGGMPPPPPAQASWYVLVDGKQQGPVAAAQLTSLIQSGTVQPDQLVWTAGMAQWAAAAAVPQLSSFFQAPPPPPPPPAAEE